MSTFDPADFPAPTLVQGRLFWRVDEMPKLREAMAQFSGRGVFEREQLLAKLRAERDRVRSRRVRRSAPRGSEQSDLFDWAFSEGE